MMFSNNLEQFYKKYVRHKPFLFPLRTPDQIQFLTTRGSNDPLFLYGCLTNDTSNTFHGCWR